jgi:hypothetical protein
MGFFQTNDDWDTPGFFGGFLNQLPGGQGFVNPGLTPRNVPLAFINPSLLMGYSGQAQVSENDQRPTGAVPMADGLAEQRKGRNLGLGDDAEDGEGPGNKKWCIEKCSDLTLPTGKPRDQGMDHIRCVEQCMGRNSYPEWEGVFDKPQRREGLTPIPPGNPVPSPSPLWLLPFLVPFPGNPVYGGF